MANIYDDVDELKLQMAAAIMQGMADMAQKRRGTEGADNGNII